MEGALISHLINMWNMFISSEKSLYWRHLRKGNEIFVMMMSILVRMMIVTIVGTARGISAKENSQKSILELK